MFPSMNTRILDIRASQPTGKVSFSGAFSGYYSNEHSSLELNLDNQDILQAQKLLNTQTEVEPQNS